MGSPITDQLFKGITLQHQGDRPVYLQLADAIQAFIKRGKLHSGKQLPATREVAYLLNINRVTVSKAYAELQMQGWLESTVGRGTFVSAHLTDHKPKTLGSKAPAVPRKKAGFTLPATQYPEIAADKPMPALHLDDGFPDPRLAPLKEFYRAYRNQITRSGLYHKFGSYGHPAGSMAYRIAISGYMNETRGLQTTAQNVLSVRGTVMGLHLVCHGLLQPGDVVISGIPGWRRAEQNFVQAKAKHIGIPVDEHGIVVDALRKICRKQQVRMVYVTPHHHYPTTVSLRIDRRLELLQLAHEYGFFIFEDDYDFDFHYQLRPLQPLASADEHGMVIYGGSFSKSFSPAFRHGYLVAAENVIEHLSRARLLLDRQGDHILDNAMADLLQDGTVQRYLRRTLTVYEERRDHFCQLLYHELKGAVSFTIPEGGMTVWTRFDPSIAVDMLAQKAFRKGLFMSDGKPHQYPTFNTNAVRLGFASSSVEELTSSVGILKKLIG